MTISMFCNYPFLGLVIYGSYIWNVINAWKDIILQGCFIISFSNDFQ